jgi:tripartite-type tricarboxylate transporter receptor subunit TctC
MFPGSGTPGHLAGELFKRMMQVDMLHVPYKGRRGGPATLTGADFRDHIAEEIVKWQKVIEASGARAG